MVTHARPRWRMFGGSEAAARREWPSDWPRTPDSLSTAERPCARARRSPRAGESVQPPSASPPYAVGVHPLSRSPEPIQQAYPANLSIEIVDMHTFMYTALADGPCRRPRTDLRSSKRSAQGYSIAPSWTRRRSTASEHAGLGSASAALRVQ